MSGGESSGGSLDAGTRAEAESVEQAALRRACQALDLVVSPGQLAALLSYLALLRRWNTTFNLTAIRDPQAMVTQHLADCLAANAAMGLRLKAAAHSPTTAPASPRVLDVGSGGGLPGVVLAIMNPAWRVTCIDAVAKKAAFVRQVAGTLPLPNLHSLHGRVERQVEQQVEQQVDQQAEQRVRQQRGESFELITARAFATLADLVRLTRPLLAPGGLWAAMKGQMPQAEIDALPPEIEAFHVEPLTVPGLDAQRCLVWMRQRRDD